MDLDLTHDLLDLKLIKQKATQLAEFIDDPLHPDAAHTFEPLLWETRTTFTRFYQWFSRHDSSVLDLNQSERRMLKSELASDLKALFDDNTVPSGERKIFDGNDLGELDPTLCINKIDSMIEFGRLEMERKKAALDKLFKAKFTLKRMVDNDKAASEFNAEEFISKRARR